MPTAGLKAWSVFWELDGQRGHNGYSYQPLSHAEIAASQEPPGETLLVWERRAILRMDQVRTRFLNKPIEKTTVSDRPMSGDLFDAVF